MDFVFARQREILGHSGFISQITSMRETSPIYFDQDTALDLIEDTKDHLNHISVKTQYEAKINMR